MTRADVSSNFLLFVKILGKFRKKTSTKLIIIFSQKKKLKSFARKIHHRIQHKKITDAMPRKILFVLSCILKTNSSLMKLAMRDRRTVALY